MRSGFRVLLSACVLPVVLPLILGAGSRLDTPADELLRQADRLFAEGRYQEALISYRRARDSADPAVHARAAGGLVLSLLRVGDFGKAHEEAQVLRQLAPGDGDAQALYGEALWASGLFEEAEEAFADALAVNPETARARSGAARALAARGQLEQAMTEAQLARQLAPGEAEFHHQVGAIYERTHRFTEAADAYENYVSRLPDHESNDKAAWTRAVVHFLRSFDRRVPVHIQGDGGERLHVIPFRLVRNKVIVRGWANDTTPVEFAIDTGAEQTVMTQGVARRAGLTPISMTRSAGVGEVGLRSVQIGRLDALQIGSLRVRNVPCIIKTPPLRGLPRSEENGFSPLALGLSMTIDYARRQVILGRALPDDSAGVELPLWMHRLPLVHGTINGEHGASFVIDTGGEVISVSGAMASRLPTDPAARRIPLKVYGTSGWDPGAYLLPGVNLDFDEIRYTKIPVVVLNLRGPSVLLGFQVGGIIGHRFLSKYRVTIDLERSTIRLAQPS